MVAVGMAVCMVLTTPASALAGTQAEEGTETQTISEETAGESILDTGTDSAKKDGETEETGLAENDGQDQQDGSDAENQADAAAVAEDTGNQTPTLTLEKAAQLAQDEAAKDKLKVDASTGTITVTDGIGLILLSNVNPSEYEKNTINLVTTSGWDLTGTAEIKGQTYSFLGLGEDANPYEGKFEFDKKNSSRKFLNNHDESTVSCAFNESRSGSDFL